VAAPAPGAPDAERVTRPDSVGKLTRVARQLRHPHRLDDQQHAVPVRLIPPWAGGPERLELRAGGRPSRDRPPGTPGGRTACSLLTAILQAPDRGS
jgi:hypothetical protein